jgi:outer membrane protein OmpA-like peptidoglycan-associated protein
MRCACLAAVVAIVALSGCSSDIEQVRNLPPPAGSGSHAAAEPGPSVVIDDSEFICHARYYLLFNFGEAAIRSDGQRALDQLLADLRSMREDPSLCGGGSKRVWVTGYTDRAGSAHENLALSLRRAVAVRQALIASGIAADRIMVSAHGEDEPAVPTPDEVREQANRRVEIIVQ